MDETEYLEHFSEIMFSKLERGELDEATESRMMRALHTTLSNPADQSDIVEIDVSLVEVSVETFPSTPASVLPDEDEFILHVDDSEWFLMDVVDISGAELGSEEESPAFSEESLVHSPADTVVAVSSQEDDSLQE